MDFTGTPVQPSWDLTNRRVEVWSVDTMSPPAVVRRLETVLSVDERERAARFGLERHRDAFIVARGVLRMLLARYVDRRSEDLLFVYGTKGKPSLTGNPLDFNVSHSDGIAVFAFARGCELGVDVERIHALTDMMEIARRFFSPGEAEELTGLPEEEREHAFFHCWTRKESYVKATGNGLFTPLRDFRVTLRPDEPARFIYVENDPSTALQWTLHNLRIAPAFAAAMAYRDQPRPVLQSSLLPAARVLEEC
jgi:4'-phosphopantetheinyl transferase